MHRIAVAPHHTRPVATPTVASRARVKIFARYLYTLTCRAGWCGFLRQQHLHRGCCAPVTGKAWHTLYCTSYVNNTYRASVRFLLQRPTSHITSSNRRPV